MQSAGANTSDSDSETAATASTSGCSHTAAEPVTSNYQQISYHGRQKRVARYSNEQIIDQIQDEHGKFEEFRDYKGRGVRTLRPLSRGDMVLEYKGVLLIGKAKVKQREEELKDNPNSYLYFFDHGNNKCCIDATEETPDSFARLINHSHKKDAFFPPNLHMSKCTINGQPRLILKAVRDIAQGEELAYDYGEREKSTVDDHPWMCPRDKNFKPPGQEPEPVGSGTGSAAAPESSEENGQSTSAASAEQPQQRGGSDDSDISDDNGQGTTMQASDTNKSAVTVSGCSTEPEPVGSETGSAAAPESSADNGQSQSTSAAGAEQPQQRGGSDDSDISDDNGVQICESAANDYGSTGEDNDQSDLDVRNQAHGPTDVSDGDASTGSDRDAIATGVDQEVFEATPKHTRCSSIGVGAQIVWPWGPASDESELNNKEKLPGEAKLATFHVTHSPLWKYLRVKYEKLNKPDSAGRHYKMVGICKPCTVARVQQKKLGRARRYSFANPKNYKLRGLRYDTLNRHYLSRHSAMAKDEMGTDWVDEVTKKMDDKERKRKQKKKSKRTATIWRSKFSVRQFWSFILYDAASIAVTPGVPIRYVEEPFKRRSMDALVRALSSSEAFNIAGRSYYTSTMAILAETTREHMAKRLQKQTRITLGSDIWSAKHGESMMCVIAYFFDEETGKPMKQFLGLKECHSTNAETVCKRFKECLDDYGISEDQIFRMVTDNGANMKKSLRSSLALAYALNHHGTDEMFGLIDFEPDELRPDEILKYTKQFDKTLQKLSDIAVALQNRFKRAWSGCFAHTIQLTVHGGLRDSPPDDYENPFRDILEAAKKLVEKVRAVPKVSLALKDSSKLFLLTAVDTRWSSTFYLTERLCLVKEAVCKIAAKHKLEVFSASDWGKLEAFNDYMGRFAYITKCIQTEKHVTASMVIAYTKQMLAWMDKQESNADRDVRKLARQMKKITLDKFAYALEPSADNFDPFWALCTLLDRKFAFRVCSPDNLEADPNNARLIEAAKEYLIRAFGKDFGIKCAEEEDDDTPPADVPTPAKAKKSRADAAVDDQELMLMEANDMGLSSDEEQDDHPTEIGQGDQQEPLLLRQFKAHLEKMATKPKKKLFAEIMKANSLEYWYELMDSSEFHQLAKVAVVCLSVPATTAAEERVFSITGKVGAADRGGALSMRQLATETIIKLNRDVVTELIENDQVPYPGTNGIRHLKRMSKKGKALDTKIANCEDKPNQDFDTQKAATQWDTIYNNYDDSESESESDNEDENKEHVSARGGTKSKISTDTGSTSNDCAPSSSNASNLVVKRGGTKSKISTDTGSTSNDCAPSSSNASISSAPKNSRRQLNRDAKTKRVAVAATTSSADDSHTATVQDKLPIPRKHIFHQLQLIGAATKGGILQGLGVPPAQDIKIIANQQKIKTQKFTNLCMAFESRDVTSYNPEHDDNSKPAGALVDMRNSSNALLPAAMHSTGYAKQRQEQKRAKRQLVAGDSVCLPAGGEENEIPATGELGPVNRPQKRKRTGRDSAAEASHTDAAASVVDELPDSDTGSNVASRPFPCPKGTKPRVPFQKKQQLTFEEKAAKTRDNFNTRMRTGLNVLSTMSIEEEREEDVAHETPNSGGLEPENDLHQEVSDCDHGSDINNDEENGQQTAVRVGQELDENPAVIGTVTSLSKDAYAPIPEKDGIMVSTTRKKTIRLDVWGKSLSDSDGDLDEAIAKTYGPTLSPVPSDDEFQDSDSDSEERRRREEGIADLCTGCGFDGLNRRSPVKASGRKKMGLQTKTRGNRAASTSKTVPGGVPASRPSSNDYSGRTTRSRSKSISSDPEDKT